MHNNCWKAIKISQGLCVVIYKQSKELRQDGRITVVKVDASSLGFCPDNSLDKVVGMATNGLLVGLQDVAHNFDLLKLHSITHVLNVGCRIPNAFEDVRVPTTVIPQSTPVARAT